jgi:hypothetical protein
MARIGRRPYHTRGILSRLLEHVRGREQKLVRCVGDAPILLLSYPRGHEEVAAEVEAAYAHTLPSLPPATLGRYQEALRRLPAIVVVLLRPLNPCGCLGHHHPKGTESRLTRRLAAELAGEVGEIDLAWQGIRDWQPLPLSSLAAAGLGEKLASMHFTAALLAVLLHELDHLAHPDLGEREIRLSSNDFYAALMEELVGKESGRSYGMAATSPTD